MGIMTFIYLIKRNKKKTLDTYKLVFDMTVLRDKGLSDRISWIIVRMHFILHYWDVLKQKSYKSPWSLWKYYNILTHVPIYIFIYNVTYRNWRKKLHMPIIDVKWFRQHYITLSCLHEDNTLPYFIYVLHLIVNLYKFIILKHLSCGIKYY